MTALIIIAAVFILSKILQSTAAQRNADRAAEERQRIWEEQAAQRRELMEIRTRAQEETRRQIEAEKARLAWQKRQDAINRQAQIDRERLRKEQERQAAQLERHEEQIEKLTFAVEQNTRDIEFYQTRTAELYAQLDNLLLLQAGTVPGSKDHTRYQSKIVTLNNQIHSAECKLAKAQFCKAQAERKLA